MMYCPLAYDQQIECFEKCIADDCGFWNEDAHMCSITAISISLGKKKQDASE